MKKFLFISLLLISPFCFSQTINFNGEEYFLNGANVPWNSFGTDVGTHYQWGALYDSIWFENMFADCQSYGINCLRLWIHCDGRSSPEFDANGNVSGLDNNFFDDFDDILQKAENHNIMIIPCLWSFDMANDNTSSAGMYAGVHTDLIADTVKTRTYINNALIPMVQRYADACNLLAWEVINEPEWCMEINGGGGTDYTVSITQMQRFVGMIAEAIHTNSSKMVTVGSASLKWNSDTYSATTHCEGNFWSDSEIQNAYYKPLALLDFYQIHYYDWMHSPYIYDPFNLSYPTSYWQLDKPTIIGEVGAIDEDYTTEQMLSNAFANSFSGVLFWSINANDGHGSFSDFNNETLQFRNNHIDIVDFSCNTTSIQESIYRKNESIHTTIVNNMLSVSNIKKGSKLFIFNVKAETILIKTLEKSYEQINLNHLPSGIYLMSIINNNTKYSEKFIKL
jgi:hypothetical protein